jgi:hypothetical protein
MGRKNRVSRFDYEHEHEEFRTVPQSRTLIEGLATRLRRLGASTRGANPRDQRGDQKSHSRPSLVEPCFGFQFSKNAIPEDMAKRGTNVRDSVAASGRTMRILTRLTLSPSIDAHRH